MRHPVFMPPRAFLNVETSATGRRWVGPGEAEERLAEAIAQTARLPLSLARILARQGVAPGDAVAYLTPALRDLLPDPLSLRDMGVAADRLLAAVRGRQRIAVFADYDVDGGASAALLITWLRAMGRQATLYIPDRIDEGYGPNVPAMQALGAAHDLIICVDCGTLSHDPIAATGCDVVVLDHHLGGETLPPALAVVNPNRQDEGGDLAHLCAASVVFLLLVEANRRLRAAGAQGPDLMAMLDLVALATVADVAPLTGVNRALVRQGLRVMARRERPGLVALADAARMTQAPNTYALGFLLGPRVNAGGRIGQADLGARLLATDDPAEAAALAERLDMLNTERRDIEAAVRAAATAQAEARGVDGPLVWAAGEGWHPGVVGIVAARLKEAFNRPAVVIGLEGDSGKGSGRSVAGVDLGATIHRLAEEGHLLRGGGHRMAAGLTVARDRLEGAMERLAELLARQGAGTGGAGDLRIDSLLSPRAATPELLERIEEAGPFGQGAPAPRFAFADVTVTARRVGEAHLRLTVSDGDARLEGIAFGALDGPLGPLLDTPGHRRLHLAGKLEINSYGGRTKVQLRLDDAAVAGPGG
jgi:single-stranded-DNA-specific exonuclease